MSTASAHSIADRACLFLDDRFIEEQSGLKRVWHQAQPIPEAIIKPDQPWEHWIHVWGTVLFDPKDQLYKIWYTNTVLLPRTPETQPKWAMYQEYSHSCYAESEDCIHWRKPKLKLATIELPDGRSWSESNALLPANSEGVHVILNPHPRNEEERFLMAMWSHQGFVSCISHDGLRWKICGNLIKPKLVKPEERPNVVLDGQFVSWDGIRNRFYCTHRTWSKHALGQKHGIYRRAVGVTWSDDFLEEWTQPVETVLIPDEQDDEMAARYEKPDCGDKTKPSWGELYQMPAWTCGNHYLGLLNPLYFVHGSDKVPRACSLQLAWSHDGLDWQRHPQREELVARDECSENLYPHYATQPVEIGEKTILYYSELDAPHPSATPRTQIRGAEWRKEGFVSMQADEAGGGFTSPTLKFKGSDLRLNYQTQKGGSIRVGVLNENGQAVPGFETENCQSLQGDRVSTPVRWKDQDNLAQLKDRPLKLKLEMTNAQIWSFSFA